MVNDNTNNKQRNSRMAILSHNEIVQAKKNEHATEEVMNIMKSLTNDNVRENVVEQLNVWSRIFIRLLEIDGKALLVCDNHMRFNVKHRVHDALVYPMEHPIVELAKELNNFIEGIEYWGIKIEDIIEEDQNEVVQL